MLALAVLLLATVVAIVGWRVTASHHHHTSPWDGSTNSPYSGG